MAALVPCERSLSYRRATVPLSSAVQMRITSARGQLAGVSDLATADGPNLRGFDSDDYLGVAIERRFLTRRRPLRDFGNPVAGAFTPRVSRSTRSARNTFSNDW